MNGSGVVSARGGGLRDLSLRGVSLRGLSLCVFCGGSKLAPVSHVRSAYNLGRIMAEEGIRLIYGGGDVGLMGSLARGCLEHGGYVHGVIPEFIVRLEGPHVNLSCLDIVETMHERTARMGMLADAFCALPGGIGTLEEVLEFSAYRSLGVHDKAIILVNLDDYWRLLFRTFEMMTERGYFRESWEPLFTVIGDEGELVAALEGLGLCGV
ncbi:MAG: TIGR00730 family Rossman fold protein [Alphaproteobacteria bacterium]